MTTQQIITEELIRNLPLELRTFPKLFHFSIEKYAEKVFLSFEEKQYTYNDFGNKTLSLLAGLTKLGIGKGSIVPIMMSNSAEYVMIWFALHLSGATMALVNPDLKGRLLEQLLSDCQCDLIFACDLASHNLKAINLSELTKLKNIVVLNNLDILKGLTVKTVKLSSLFIDKMHALIHESSFQDIQSIFYTSGSSGPSKGVLMPNAHFFANPCTFIRLSNLKSDDVIFNALPLFHGVGSRQGVLPAFMVGAQISLAAKFSATNFWNFVSKSKATIALLTPSMPSVLLAKEPNSNEKKHNLRAIYNVPHDNEFEKRFNVTMLVSFAITEIGAVIYTPFGKRRIGSMGLAHEDWELAIVDSHDNLLPIGKEGELVCRPKKPFIMMTGYLNQPGSTTNVFRNLWYHTSDFMYQDSDGFFYFTGRDKDRIRRRGENISPLEIENEIRTHPSIADCIAVGFPASDGEDEIRVFLLVRDGEKPPPLMNLHDWLNLKLPKSMTPRYYEFIEEFPVTSTQKIDRRFLKDLKISTKTFDTNKIT